MASLQVSAAVCAAFNFGEAVQWYNDIRSNKITAKSARTCQDKINELVDGLLLKGEKNASEFPCY